MVKFLPIGTGRSLRTYLRSIVLSVSFCLFLLLYVWFSLGSAVLADNSSVTFDWMWSGAVTSTSAVVKVKVRPNNVQARLLLAINTAFHNSRLIPENGFIHPDQDGVIAFNLEGLEPDTLYYYRVEIGDRKSDQGRFRTFLDGPLSFQAAFASCASTGSNHRVFSTIKNLEPDFFIHMGDFHYEDIERNDSSLYRRAFDRVLKSPRQSELYRYLPIAYIWDDHDFGPDGSDGQSPGKPAALKTYQQYVPHYPLEKDGEGVRTINQAFSVGRVRFIMTDGRAERTPADDPDGPQKTMLGEHQRYWLEQELAAARETHVLVVWINPVPWITKNSRNSNYGWEPYSYERTLIADKIKSFDMTDKLVILSGDAHMVAIDDGTNSNYASSQKPGERAFPVIQAAPLDRYPRVKGGPYSHGFYARKRWFGLLKEQQFGFMKVQDNGKTLKVEFSGRDADGELLPGMLLKMRCDESGCRTIG